jgi:hypothetical protein
MVRRAGILAAVRWLLITLVLLAGACGGGEKENVPRSAIAVYHLEVDLRGPSPLGEIVCLPAAGACPNGAPGEMAQYLVVAGARLDGDDVEREKTRTDFDPATGQPVVLLSLTESGAQTFRGLSKSIARAGRSSGSPHHIAVVVDGELVGWPALDYEAFPNGFEHASSVKIAFGDEAAAKRLVERVRR